MLAWFASVQSASADGSVVINEISPGDANGASSWVELYNSSTDTSVDLGYWQLDTGSEETDDSYYIPINTSILPGGYLVFERSMTGLAIVQSGTLRLHALDPDSFEHALVDQIDYAISDDGAGLARVPDGSENWVVISTLTKGTSNPTPTPTPTPTPIPIPSPTPIPIPSPSPIPIPSPTPIPIPPSPSPIPIPSPTPIPIPPSPSPDPYTVYTTPHPYTVAFTHTIASAFTNTIAYAYTYTDANASSHTKQFHRHQRNLFFARQAGPSRSSALPRSCPICFQFKWEASR